MEIGSSEIVGNARSPDVVLELCTTLVVRFYFSAQSKPLLATTHIALEFGIGWK